MAFSLYNQVHSQMISPARTFKRAAPEQTSSHDFSEVFEKDEAGHIMLKDPTFHMDLLRDEHGKKRKVSLKNSLLWLGVGALIGGGGVALTSPKPKNYKAGKSLDYQDFTLHQNGNTTKIESKIFAAPFNHVELANEKLRYFCNRLDHAKLEAHYDDNGRLKEARFTNDKGFSVGIFQNKKDPAQYISWIQTKEGELPKSMHQAIDLKNYEPIERSDDVREQGELSKNEHLFVNSYKRNSNSTEDAFVLIPQERLKEEDFNKNDFWKLFDFDVLDSKAHEVFSRLKNLVTPMLQYFSKSDRNNRRAYFSEQPFISSHQFFESFTWIKPNIDDTFNEVRDRYQGNILLGMLGGISFSGAITILINTVRESRQVSYNQEKQQNTYTAQIG